MAKKSNSNLRKAAGAKNDEFFTQYSAIDDEVKHYVSHFKNKVVLCNCDDPMASNFFKYFHGNFKPLGLKKLITTHYHDTRPTYKLEYTLNTIGRRYPTKTILRKNGDFRNDESIAILKKADIVVTNPPFSLFREYVAQLMEYDKKFLIVGNTNALCYKEIFPLIRDNNLWVGCTYPKEFTQPDGSVKKFGNINWFTNLTHKKRNAKLILTEKYNPKDYPKYDNYPDAINVDKVANIPRDYTGKMGVPLTFINKYNPAQFEIIANFNAGDQGAELGATTTSYYDKKGNLKHWNGPTINKESKYIRFIIKRK